MTGKDRAGGENGEAPRLDALNPSVLNALRSQLAIVDRHGTVVFINDAWVDFARRCNSSAIIRNAVGTNYFKLDADAISRSDSGAKGEIGAIQSVLKGELNQYHREYVCHSDTRQRWFEMSVRSLKESGLGALIVHADVSDTKVTEQVLRESHQTLEARMLARTSELAQANMGLRNQIEERDRAETQFRGLLDSAPDAIVIVNESGSIELVNSRAEAMFGYERSELIGHKVEKLLPKSLQGRHVAHREAYVQAPQVRPMGEEMELNATTKSGRELPVEISLSPLLGETDTLISAAIRDVSERRHHLQMIETARREAERSNSAKSRFLAFASHDLRQPLQALGIYLDVLKNKTIHQDSLAIIDDMNSSLGTMGALLNALLDISKLEAKTVSPEIIDFPVQELLERILSDTSPHAKDKGLEVRVIPSSLVVRSDPTLLDQIVRNFVMNAIRYTNSGRILVGCRRRGSNVSIEVWDTGIGIADDSIDTIFEEFVQLDNEARDRNKGLGLGLAIVKRTAELLGHRLVVGSRVGKGSVFSVQVPIGHVRPKDGEATVVAAAGQSISARILLVDDDTDIVRATQLLLSLKGFDVVSATSAADALREIESTQFHPDLLLCDYRLPHGTTGVELVSRLREALGDEGIPAIISTGDTSPTRLRDTASISCEVLHKPTGGEALVSTIRRLLRNR